MNKSIIFLVTIFSLSSTFAQEQKESLPIEHYSYGQNLDIAKVIQMETPAKVCGVVLTHMIYLDSKGTKHNLEYSVMGDGCSNG